MSKPDRDIDIRAFLSRDRERILRAVRKRSRPHLTETEFLRHDGTRLRAWIDRDHANQKAHVTQLNGYVAKAIIGIAEDEVIISQSRGSLSTLKLADLPYEDLMKVSSFVARRFPAPPIERQSEMLAVGMRPEPTL